MKKIIRKVKKETRKLGLCSLLVISITLLVGFNTPNNEKCKKVYEKTAEYNNKSQESSYTTKIKVSKTASVKLSPTETKYLACIVFAEAGNEPYSGQVAVANVVLNRMRSSKYPNSVQGVVRQKGQFGPCRNGALSRELKKYSTGKYKSGCRKVSLNAAKEAMNGKNLVGSRKFFNGAKVEIRKGHKNALRIKNHLFW